MQITLGQALAEAGMCCKAFAICVREAATIVADRHGWCLLEVGSSPMRHLSKLELDTKLVLSFLRDQTTYLWTRWRLQLVALWTDEVDARFIGARFIDPQVLRQHTAELGRYLIKLAMDVCPDDPRHDVKMTKAIRQLRCLMMQPNPPLDVSSWLADHVIPLVNKHMQLKSVDVPNARCVLHKLLGYLEPQVLRSHPKIFEWVQLIMKGNTSEGRLESTMWAAGLRAWNERCEAQGLKLGPGCDKGTRDTTLEVLLDPQVRGCFVRLSALGMPVDDDWWQCVGEDVFPAVYHRHGT